MVTVPSSAYNINLSRNPSSEINNNDDNNLRDASFSSYLNANEENFIRQLAQSSRTLKPIMLNSEEDDGDVRKSVAVEDGEIGVFGAEKYFNGEMDEDKSPRLISKTSSETRSYHTNGDRGGLSTLRPKSRAAGTPSVRSESSWNSQSALLKSAARISPWKNNRNSKCKAFFANLGCSCSDSNSADVEEGAGKKISANKEITNSDSLPPRKSPADLNGKNSFTFPTRNLEPETKIQGQEEGDGGIQRTSLEVFGSPVLEKRAKSLSLERKLAVLSWDMNPRTDAHDANETDSDASSDLFEIESLTGKAKTFLAAQETDEHSGYTTPATGYAPSEASIEWSVVTASAADFSVASDYEELRSCTPRAVPVRKTAPKNFPEIKAKQRRSSGLLSGCKSQKAVRVSGDAYRTGNYEARVCHAPEGGAKVAGFESRHRIVSSSRSVSLSPSPRPLYIQ